MKNVITAGMLVAAVGCVDGELEDGESSVASELQNGSASADTPTNNAIVSIEMNNGYFCTGTLVSPNTVITAGHCMNGNWVTGDDHSRADGDWHRFRHGAYQNVYFGPNRWSPNPISPIRASYLSFPPMLHPETGTGHDDIVLIGLDEPVPSSVAIPRGIVYEDPGIDAYTTFGFYGMGGTRVRYYSLASGFVDASTNPSLTANFWNATLHGSAMSEGGDSGAPILHGGTAGPVAGVLQGPEDPTTTAGTFGIRGVKTYGHGEPDVKPDISDWLQERAGQQKWSRKGWAWTASASGSGNLASSTYMHNSSGGTITIENIGTGVYKAVFAGLAQEPGGHVQVAAYGPGSERCKVSLFNRTGANANAFVFCHNAAGAFANSRFVIAYTGNGHLQADGAYVLADSPATWTYVPSNQFNAKEYDATVYKITVGMYRVRIPQQSTGGVALVTAYGSSDSTYCKASSITGGAPAALDVIVACYDNAGVAVDRKFLLDYQRGSGNPWPGAGPQSYGTVGFALAHDPAASSWYQPSSWYNVLANNTNFAKRNSLGSYTVFVDNATSGSSGALVTAYGSDNNYCKPTSWSTGSIPSAGAGINVNVACFAPGGAASSARFAAMYMQDLDGF